MDWVTTKNTDLSQENQARCVYDVILMKANKQPTNYSCQNFSLNLQTSRFNYRKHKGKENIKQKHVKYYQERA